jgi:hypothetical protein
VASVVHVGSSGVTTADVEFPAPVNGVVGTGGTQNGTVEGVR